MAASPEDDTPKPNGSDETEASADAVPCNMPADGPQPAANPAEEALRRSVRKRGTGLQRLVKKVDRAIARTTGELQAYGEALAALIRERGLHEVGAEPGPSTSAADTAGAADAPTGPPLDDQVTVVDDAAAPTGSAATECGTGPGVSVPAVDDFAVLEFAPEPVAPSAVEVPSPPLAPVEMPPLPAGATTGGMPAVELHQTGFQRLIRKVDRAIKRSTEEIQVHAQALSQLIQQRRGQKPQPQHSEPQPALTEQAPADPSTEHHAGFQDMAASVRRVIRRKTAEMANFREQLARLVEETRQKEHERQRELESSQQLQAVEPPPEPLDKYRYASLCPSKWEDLSGTDRYRLCKQCQLFVYDFQKLDLTAAQRLVFQREGVTNPTFYKRGDARFLTQDCPVGIQRRQKRLTAIAAVVVLLAGMLGLMFLVPPPKPPVVTSTAPATVARQRTGRSSRSIGGRGQLVPGQTLPGGGGVQAPPVQSRFVLPAPSKTRGLGTPVGSDNLMPQ
jgi:hypothetical protein